MADQGKLHDTVPLNHWHLFDSLNRTMLRFANEEDARGYVRMRGLEDGDVRIGSCSLSQNACISEHKGHTSKGKDAVRLSNNARE